MENFSPLQVKHVFEVMHLWYIKVQEFSLDHSTVFFLLLDRITNGSFS